MGTANGFLKSVHLDENSETNFIANDSRRHPWFNGVDVDSDVLWAALDDDCCVDVVQGVERIDVSFSTVSTGIGNPFRHRFYLDRHFTIEGKGTSDSGQNQTDRDLHHHDTLPVDGGIHRIRLESNGVH